MSCDPNFTFWIDGHILTVIEADRENTVTHPVDELQIFAGQRYSVVVIANQPVANYWVRADPDKRGKSGFDGRRNSAILRYAGAPNAVPAPAPSNSEPPQANPRVVLKESSLYALTDLTAPGLPFVGGADVNLVLYHDVDFKELRFTMNGVSWSPPTVPVLLQILSGTQTAQGLLPQGSYYELPRNKVIELSLPGTGEEHGEPTFSPSKKKSRDDIHTFSVVRSGDSEAYNYVNPIRRDTVNTGFAGGNATIRFVTDNAGSWVLHCHIDWHPEMGLAVVFAEDVTGTPAANPVPDAWKDKYESLNADEQ
ncbi:hypothetical protein DXG03_008347 [Asterophora parasitica]|uniref:laccase n=1 Tax=Asterophora parasitica TaxID=117018 RepID=A0A9P7G943_9AGAR|nr:hypothetical protein DXG03_008347 [Asterophora parasitica]